MMCYACESTDLASIQMTHSMSNRVGLVPIARADGSQAWVSGKERKCNACGARMKDYDGPMLAQMTENMLEEIPCTSSRGCRS